MKISVFCVMTLHSFVYLYRHFGVVLQGSLRRVDPLRFCPFLTSLKMEASISSETLVPTYKPKGRRAQEVSISTGVRTLNLLYINFYRLPIKYNVYL